MESNQLNSPNSFGKHESKDNQFQRKKTIELKPICQIFNHVAFEVHINDFEVAIVSCAIDIWKNELLLSELIKNLLKSL